MDRGSFSDRLASLVSKEATQARNDPERMAALIERLAHSLGFAVAMTGRGNAEAIGTLLEGVIGHIYESAADTAPLAVLASIATRRPPSSLADGGK